jgi:hypothetical protein
MYRTVPAIVLVTGVILPTTLRAGGTLTPDAPAATAEEAFQKSLAKAEKGYLLARIEARSTLLAAVAEAKRTAISSGDLETAECLAEREREIECEQAADRESALRIDHELSPRAKLDVQGGGFVLKILRNGATAYSNRDYKWANVPEALDGWTYTQIDGGDTPEFRAEVVKGGVAYVMAESLELADYDWLHRPDLAFHWYPGRDAMSVFSKRVESGQTLVVPHIGWTGTMILLESKDSEDH